MTGSSTQPFALGTMSRTAAAVAMRKAISLESTAWACVESYVAARQGRCMRYMNTCEEQTGVDTCDTCEEQSRCGRACLSIGEHDPEALHGVSCEVALGYGVLHSLLTRGDVLGGNVRAHYFVDKLVVLGRVLAGLHVTDNLKGWAVESRGMERRS